MTTHKSVVTFTWNPDWNTIKALDLDQQLILFKEFIACSQQEFLRQENEPNAICLMVAPDLIFSKGPSFEIQSYNDFLHFSAQICLMQKDLLPTALVIAGSIDYATQDGCQYKMTMPIVSANYLAFYDKKIPAGTKKFKGKIVPMKSGELDGYIEFQGLQIGVEICQDHQEKTLINTLKNINKTVGIQILSSHGQCRRDFALVRPSSQNEIIFMHLELEAGSINHEGRKLESANYRVRLKNIEGSHRFINNVLQAVELKPIETNTIVSDDPNLSSIRYFTISQKCKLDYSRDSFSLVDVGSPADRLSETKSFSFPTHSPTENTSANLSQSPMSISSRSRGEVGSPPKLSSRSSVSQNRYSLEYIGAMKPHTIMENYFDLPEPKDELALPIPIQRTPRKHK